MKEKVKSVSSYERNRVKGEKNLEQWSETIIEKFQLNKRVAEFKRRNELTKVHKESTETIFDFVVKELTPELPSIFYTEPSMPHASLARDNSIDIQLFNIGWPIIKKRILKKLDQE